MNEATTFSEQLKRQQSRYFWLGDLFTAIFFLVLFKLIFQAVIAFLPVSTGAATVASFSAAAFTAVLAIFVVRGGSLRDFLLGLGFQVVGGIQQILLTAITHSMPALIAAAFHALLMRTHSYAAFFGAARIGSELNAGMRVAPGWQILMVIVIAPICEEIIFRGLIFRDLKLRFGFSMGAFVSAIIFASLHPTIAFIPIFMLSLCAARAFERSKSLLAPMMIHSLYNLTVLLTV